MVYVTCHKQKNWVWVCWFPHSKVILSSHLADIFWKSWMFFLAGTQSNFLYVTLWVYIIIAGFKRNLILKFSKLVFLCHYCSVQMVTLYAQVANPGSITGALLVGMSLAISDAWHWRKWLRLWNFPVNIKVLGASVYIHITAS